MPNIRPASMVITLTDIVESKEFDLSYVIQLVSLLSGVADVVVLVPSRLNDRYPDFYNELTSLGVSAVLV